MREYPLGRAEVVELEDTAVMRMTHQPGWRWSTHTKPRAGTERCQFHHLGVTLQGRLRVEMPDGTELEVGPGDVFEIPPGHDAWVAGDIPWIAVDFGAVRTYGRADVQSGHRSLVTILFTDIADSTANAVQLGDTRWRELLAEHNRVTEQVVSRQGGRIVAKTGDGVLAAFDGAERAVRAAIAVRGRMRLLHLEIRAGLHTGEAEVRTDTVRGIATHTAARIMALAAPGEILVSSTTHDLLDGADLTFTDRGRHALKGLTGERQVFAVDEP